MKNLLFTSITNMGKLKYIAAIAVACAGFVVLAPKASAVALTIGDTQELGFVNFGIPADDSDRTTYVNHLVGMAINGHDFGDGQEYFRSGNDFGPLPAAIFNQNNGGGNPSSFTSLNLGTGVYSYLLAKYDGPGFGSEVWYVGNLSGTITIPEFGSPDGQDQISGWTLFTGGAVNVPDGGSTIAFLGLALAAVELLRRAVSRRAVKA
jgi:VPDSG-CTERM motif